MSRSTLTSLTSWRLGLTLTSLTLAAACGGGEDEPPPAPPSTVAIVDASDPCGDKVPTPSNLFFDADGQRLKGH